MTENSSRLDDTYKAPQKNILGWLLFPISLFPLVALLTYDWRTSDSLHIPALPSSNWIGAVGDTFAYYGYLLFGLAIWIVPIFCIILAICLVMGLQKSFKRNLWVLISLICFSCLVQIAQNHTPGISSILSLLNIPHAGGAFGFLLITKLLSPLLSDFGATIIISLLLLISIIAFIGLHNIALFFVKLVNWTFAKSSIPEPDENASNEEKEAYNNIMRAREEVQRQKEEEKARIREAKEAARRAKEEARRIKEEEKAAKELARREAKERLISSANTITPQPQPPPAPAPAAIVTNREVPQANFANSVAASSPQPQEDKGPYILPPLSLLNPLKPSTADHSDVAMMSQKLIDTLKIFKIDAQMSYTVQGPVVTKYALMLAPGTYYSKVTGMVDNLQGALHAKSLRIEAPIPGEECIGIEVPNLKPAGISFREIIESDAWKNAKMELPLLFGKDAAGKELIADLASMPHMLVAGATGQGKSVCLNSLINGLLMTRTPEQLKLIMVDPKSVEFTPYAAIPHLLVPVITDNRKVVFALNWAVAEMETRLKLFARARVKNIYDFNHRKTFSQPDMFSETETKTSDMPKTVPYIVIIIDEVADLMSSSAKEVTPNIARLTAKARAAGIHLILATQRPDAKVITGTIKANIPGRVAFKTASAVDSRTILDDSGAENLIGKGDMLFRGKDGILVRAQGSWISDDEIANITSFIEQHSTVQFDEKFATKLGRVKEAAIDDPFASNEDDPDNQQEAAPTGPTQRELVKAAANADDFKKAIECIINTKRASTSHFQRQMGWGYNHAAKILDQLTEKGIVSPQQGMGPRQIIMDQDQLLAILNGGAPNVAQENNDIQEPAIPANEDFSITDDTENTTNEEEEI